MSEDTYSAETIDEPAAEAAGDTDAEATDDGADAGDAGSDE